MAELTGIKQRELIELVQKHHPGLGDVEIRELLNEAQSEICEESGIIHADITDTTVSGTRFYDLDELILEIKRVELTDADGKYYEIPRLVNKPDSGESV